MENFFEFEVMSAFAAALRELPRPEPHSETKAGHRRYIGMMRLIVPLLLLLATDAMAQHNHAEGHNEYATWASHKATNCCNNMDCGVLNDDEWRETSEGTQVKISGQWCPVLPEHFIIRGKSPDWSKAHACVQPDVNYSTGRKTPCERLLCFSGTAKY